MDPGPTYIRTKTKRTFLNSVELGLLLAGLCLYFCKLTQTERIAVKPLAVSLSPHRFRPHTLTRSTLLPLTFHDHRYDIALRYTPLSARDNLLVVLRCLRPRCVCPPARLCFDFCL